MKSGEGRISVELEVARNSAEVQGLLSGIENVQVTETDGNLIKLSVPADPAIREQIAKIIVERNMGLLAMNVSRLALEDIFIRLTRSEESQ